jgi:hypothetical protein
MTEFEIVVAPVKKPGRFEARLGGELLIASSRIPFCAAARALIAQGRDLDATLIMRHRGSDAVALHARLGTAAGLKVDERQTRLVRWNAFLVDTVWPPVASNEEAASSLSDLGLISMCQTSAAD